LLLAGHTVVVGRPIVGRAALYRAARSRLADHTEAARQWAVQRAHGLAGPV